MSDILIYEVAQQVATLTLNRPEHRNALSPELAGELIMRLRDAGEDPLVKCVVIQGAGEHLSAGGDVKSFASTLEQTSPERYDLFERRLMVGNRLPGAVLDCPKPVIVLARGAVAGAGMSLCLAADFVIAGESAIFMAAQVLLGLNIDCGLSSLLVASMGIKAAKKMALLGDRISACDAQALGLVTQVLPDAEVADAVKALSERLAQGPRVAMRLTKGLLNQAAYPGYNDLIRGEATGIATCAASDDFKAGVQAALDRKRARFD